VTLIYRYIISINIALLCVQESAADRPTMSEVMAKLINDSVTLLEPKHRAFFNLRVTNKELSTVVASSVNGMTMSTVFSRIHKRFAHNCN
jgi:hypothetical protein